MSRAPGAISRAVNQALLPRRYDINVFLPPATQTNWSSRSVQTTSLLNGVISSSNAQNDEIGWDVVLAAGTWECVFLHRKNNNRGIYSVRVDGVEIGTEDGYNSSIVENVVSAAFSFAVTAPGVKRLLLKMATKNASSSNYNGTIIAVGLRKTA